MGKLCLRCGNTDEHYFYNDNGIWYCRKCVNFGRLNIGVPPIRKKHNKKRFHCNYHLKYPLTPQQLRCQKETLWHLSQHKSVLVYAACGARKNGDCYGIHQTVFEPR